MRGSSPADDQGTIDELKRTSRRHIRLRFNDAGTLGKAQEVIARPRRADEEALSWVPTSGGVPELRGILTRLDDCIDVAEPTVHTPDLDDVFLTLTGN